MKKDYLRPEAEIIDIVTSCLMQTTSTELGEGNGGEVLSNDHRGDWNNIWGEEE